MGSTTGRLVGFRSAKAEPPFRGAKGDSVSRRHFLHECGVGLGKIAAASLLAGALPQVRAGSEARVDLAPRAPHFQPKAKAVIHLFMAGAPSQLDLFDYKPKLVEY